MKIQEAAKRAGFEVVFVKSREDAVIQAKKNPAVIILDLNMTGADPFRSYPEFEGGRGDKRRFSLGLCFACAGRPEACRPGNGLPTSDRPLGFFTESAHDPAAVRGSLAAIGNLRGFHRGMSNGLLQQDRRSFRGVHLPLDLQCVAVHYSIRTADIGSSAAARRAGM